MKKLKPMLFSIFLLCLMIFSHNSQSVFAQSFTTNTIFTENTQIDGETDGDLLIEGVQSGSAIVIESGANVTLKNLTIEIAEGQTFDSVISIEAGAKLILENVIVMLSSKPQKAIIENSGVLEIDNCDFPNISSIDSFVDILNSSDEVGAITLHNIAEKSLTRIKLLQGSVYVDESTAINGVINLCIEEDYSVIAESGERYIGRALVKGINTFAGKFLNNFQFDGAPIESEIDGSSDYLFENFKDSYYLDYVGNLGDDLSICDDGYIVTYNDGESDVYVDTIDSGDIILTQFCIRATLTEDAVKSMGIDSKFLYKYSNSYYLFVGGKYATSRMFVKYAKLYELGNFYASGTIIKKTTETEAISTGTSSYKFVLDNTTALLGNSKKIITICGAVSFQTLQVKSFCVNQDDVYDDTNALAIQSLDICPSILVNGETDILYTSHCLACVDLNGYLFEEIIAGEGLSVKRLASTQNYEILDIEIGESFAGDVKVLLREALPTTKNVTLEIDKSSFDYTGLNQINNCTPYYMNGEERVYLNENEFAIYRVENDTLVQTEQITSAGDYKIVALEVEGFVFENTEFDIVVSPRGLNLVYTNTEFIYDGEEKFVDAVVYGLVDGESVDIQCNGNGKILPGSYTISTEIISGNKGNYYILDDCKECTLFIDKATIDMSQVVVEDRMVEYTGEQFSISPKNDITGLRYITSGAYSDAGTYPIQVTFFVTDLNLYYPLKDNENIKNAVLTINPKTIDLSYIQFNDIHHTYDGTAVNVTISQELLSSLPKEVSKEITIVGDGVVNASDIPYDVSIMFKLGSSYIKNFVLSPATHTCNIYIDKASVDESVFVFEDLTTEYDGVAHITQARNIPQVVQCENVSGAKTECGTYKQIFRLTLLDMQNYNSLEKDEYTATLVISPATFDMTEVEFSDEIVTYEPNYFYVLQASGYSEHLQVSYKYYLNGSEIDDADQTGVCNAGEYTIIASFTPIGEWVNNSNPISDMTAKLIIEKKVIDLSNVVFQDSTIIYDGDAHSLLVTNAGNIAFEYTQNSFVNAGRYEIIATPIFDAENYKLKDNIELKAVLTINKATIDMTNIKFDDVFATYDKQLKVAKIEGELPNGVSVVYTNNEQINAGEYIAVASFNMADSINYEAIPNKTCTIIIEQKSVSVNLTQSIFEYTGEPIFVTAYLQGVIDGDIVNVTLKNNGNTNASKYYSEIILSNSNYKCPQSLVSYTIEKADLDLSKITFNEVEVTYDGKEHTPKLEGNLPTGVTANVISNKVINVGEYVSYVDFVVVNPNYKTPERLVAHSKVLPKPILVEFSNYKNLVEDGSKHDVTINFVGLVEDNFDEYKVVYSAEPVEAGEYSLKVELNENSNYVILGTNTLNFEILTSEKTYINQDLEILIKGDGFSTNSKIVLIQDGKNIEEKLLDAGITPKEYSAFKLEMNDVENRKQVSVTLKPNTINIANSKSIKVYKISNNQLTEVDFEVRNNKINFVANLGDEIVVVEEKGELEKNQLIIAVVIISALVSVGIVVFVILKKRPKKKKVDYFIDVDM